jgi:hypothetical protein
MANGNSYTVEIPQTLLWKVRNFPEEVYSFGPESNLTTLMSVLLNGPGTGQLSAIQLAARLTYVNLQFSDLENILGTLINSPRLVSELYSSDIDPFQDQLTLAQWQEVLSKDSSYRERLIATMQALLKGATAPGVQAMSEATTSIKFQVLENWTAASGVITASGWGRNLGPSEVIVIPIVPSGLTFTDSMRYSLIRVLDNIMPVNSLVTVATGTLNNFTPVTINNGTTNSEYSYLTRYTTGQGISIPSYVNTTNNSTVNSRYWLRNNQTSEAPFFAFGQTQEKVIDLTGNINNITVTNSGNLVGNTQDPIGAPVLSIDGTVFG